MQIDQEELRRRLDSTRNLATALVPSVPAPLPGPVPLEETEIPKRSAISTRIVAGSLARQGEDIKDIAREFGMLDSQVRSASKSNDPKIKGPIKTSLDKVNELAIEKLMLVLGLMASEKLVDSNAKDLSIIGANMSRIIEKTREHVADDARVQLIIYAPEARTERSYRVVDV